MSEHKYRYLYLYICIKCSFVPNNFKLSKKIFPKMVKSTFKIEMNNFLCIKEISAAYILQ